MCPDGVMAAAPVSRTGVFGRVGSTPSLGTKDCQVRIIIDGLVVERQTPTP